MGLHLDPVKCTCDDLPLAKRVEEMMKKLGADNGGDDLMDGASKAEKDIRKKCTKLASAFRDFKTMFLTIDNVSCPSFPRHSIADPYAVP
jgi:hypothetical protein